MSMDADIIETLQRYVPGLIIRRLVDDQSPISTPTAVRLAAAVLFVDITDFTSLADRLSQQEPRGAEVLAELLNDCFGRLISIIHAHGGEVTKFAGDALIALWSVPENVTRLSSQAHDSLVEMSQRATQCGLAIQNALNDYKVTDGSRLYLQIGIGAGDVYSIHLGGVLGRWEFLLSGSPLVQMSLAKERALPGRVVLSPEVWQLVKESVRGHLLDQGFVDVRQILNPIDPKSEKLPKLPVKAKNSLKAYVPAAIFSRLEAGHEKWLSEFRRVSVMFIKLPQYGTSIKHPYMRTLPDAQAVMQALQSALYRYAGSINKFNVDDKGITLVCALGLPPLSHLDDSARAIHAAIEMQKALEKLGRKSAIGITTGWVFCGPIGNELRREYTMVGTTVNMAARLMQAAELNLTNHKSYSAILCDETTFTDIQAKKAKRQPLSEQFSFRTVNLRDVKGKSEPITAYIPILNSGSSLKINRNSKQRVNIIGLRLEREKLAKIPRQLVVEGESSGSNLTLLEGQTGSGKSLLIGELISLAEKQGIRTLFSVGHVLEQTTPYFIWRTIFQSMFDVDLLAEDLLVSRSRVLSQLPAIRGERGFPAFAIRLSPLLNSVLPLDFPENRTTRKMAADVRQRVTRKLLLRLLERDVSGTGLHKPKPTLLVIDNGQWLDEASWDLLFEASQLRMPFQIVLATRPLDELRSNSRFERVSKWLDGAQNITRIKVRPLNDEEIITLLQQQLQIQSIPEEVLSVLRFRAGGDPMYCIELISDWIERDLIQVEEWECRLTTNPELLEVIPAPDFIQQMITGRLERLSPCHQLLVKIASVLGRTFAYSDLEKAYPNTKDKERLPLEISKLEQYGIFEKTPSSMGLTYTYTTGLLQEATINLLPSSVRSRILEGLTNST